MKSFFLDSRLDFIGFSASLVCAIHCIALPFLISALPMLGLSFLTNPKIEYMIIVLSFFMAVFAIFQGYKKHHRKLLPMILVIIGFGIIASGLFYGHGHADEFIQTAGPIELKEIKKNSDPFIYLIMPIGAILVSLGHYFNWLYIKKSKPGCTIPSIKNR